MGIAILALAAGLMSVAAYLRQSFLQAALLAAVAIIFAMGSGALWGRK